MSRLNFIEKDPQKNSILNTNKSSAAEQLQIIGTNNHCFYNLAYVVQQL